jgi:sensor histidine kinase YesM
MIVLYILAAIIGIPLIIIYWQHILLGILMLVVAFVFITFCLWAYSTPIETLYGSSPQMLLWLAGRAMPFLIVASGVVLLVCDQIVKRRGS